MSPMFPDFRLELRLPISAAKAMSCRSCRSDGSCGVAVGIGTTDVECGLSWAGSVAAGGVVRLDSAVLVVVSAEVA